MAITKVGEFKMKERKVASLCKALAHPSAHFYHQFFDQKERMYLQ